MNFSSISTVLLSEDNSLVQLSIMRRIAWRIFRAVFFSSDQSAKKNRFKRIKTQQNSKGATVIRLDGNKVIRLEGNPVECQDSASEYVFTYKGKRVKNIKKAFQTALKNAGITDFRFHDLRHAFASQVIMRGGGLKDVQELLGHKSMSMTLRYSHLSQKHKKRAVNLLNGLTGSARNRHDVTNDAYFGLQKGL